METETDRLKHRDRDGQIKDIRAETDRLKILSQ